MGAPSPPRYCDGAWGWPILIAIYGIAALTCLWTCWTPVMESLHDSEVHSTAVILFKSGSRILPDMPVMVSGQQRWLQLPYGLIPGNSEDGCVLAATSDAQRSSPHSFEQW